MHKRKVIVDTNALLIPGTFGIDIYEELEDMGYLEIIIPESVMEELNALRNSESEKGRTKRAAQIGYQLVLQHLQLANGRSRVVIERKGGDTDRDRDTDSEIIRMAKMQDAAVLTSDAELRRRLHQEGLSTVFLRGRNRLVAD